MSLIPVFELGLWNAWIFIIPLLILHIISAQVFAPRGATGQPAKVLLVLFFILHMLPILLSLKLNSIWFYVGFFFYMVGMIVTSLAIYSFATTPKDKPVTKGVFRFSRNPMYLGGFTFFIGIGLMSVSWIYILITVLWLILLHVIDITIEEYQCIEKYGKEYQEYMNRTPRWIGLPKKSL